MKKTLALLLIAVFSLIWTTYAAEDTVQDNWTTVDQTTEAPMETLSVTLVWEKQVDWDTVILPLSFKDVNTKIIGWNFDIILPEGVEYVDIEKWEALWEDDEVTGTLDWNILTVEFTSEWAEDNTLPFFNLKLKNFDWDNLEVSPENNEILTDSDITLSIWNIEISNWNENVIDDTIADTTEEQIQTNENEQKNIETSTGWVEKTNITKEETKTNTWKEEVSFAILLLLMIVLSSILIKRRA